MKVTYNNNHYTCNLDWLQFSVLTDTPDPEIMCPDGLRLEICNGNNIFENRALVYDSRGAKILTLLWKPYSKVLPSNLMTVQVANEYLYLPSGMGIKWAWDDVQQIVDCTFNAIGRFDVCLDFEGSPNRNEFLRHLNSGHYYAQRKSEGSSWWHSIDEAKGVKNQLHCLSWGSKKSEIKVKIYHKSREQGLLNSDQPEKPWIVDEWSQMGMDCKNVWRLEFSFSGAGQLRHRGKIVSLDNLSDSEWLLQVLCDSYHHRFVTRRNEGKRQGHKNNDDRVYLLDLPDAPSMLKWADPKAVDHETPASITLLRSLMRQIDNPAIICHRPTYETYASTIQQVIRDHRLYSYFLRTYQSTPDDYFAALSTEVGVGLHKTTPSPSRLMD